MKARIPKPYSNLPKKEKEVIARLIEEECLNMLDEEEVRLFLQYTKITCSILHNYFGFGEQRLLTFIGNFKNVRRKYKNVTTATELEEMLDKELENVFKDGFPADFVEDLQRGR